jgi:hypothetical protein
MAAFFVTDLATLIINLMAFTEAFYHDIDRFLFGLLRHFGHGPLLGESWFLMFLMFFKSLLLLGWSMIMVMSMPLLLLFGSALLLQLSNFLL